MQKAIFLDRDGTLIEEVNYLSNLSQIKIYPFAVDALTIFKNLGYKIIIISNQSGIARGFFDEKFVHSSMNFIIEKFLEKNIKIDDYFFCPHHPNDNCNCRKPKPDLFIQASQKYNIDLTKSWIIGDSIKDIESSKNTGAKAIHVLTGHGKAEILNYKLFYLHFSTLNLYTAALFIKNLEK